MKMRYILIVDREFKISDYPGAKTSEDAVKMQQTYIDDGDISIEDITIGEVGVQVRLID